jgi:small subunit ribosomal protein S17
MSEVENPQATAPAEPALVGQRRALRKERVGQVVSTSMNKTCVVETVTRVPHPRFRKIIKHRKRFYVHDEEGKAQLGDQVRIMETRPISKLKRWRLVEIIKH